VVLVDDLGKSVVPWDALLLTSGLMEESVTDLHSSLYDTP
jgi:hypothetical protein